MTQWFVCFSLVVQTKIITRKSGRSAIPFIFPPSLQPPVEHPTHIHHFRMYLGHHFDLSETSILTKSNTLPFMFMWFVSNYTPNSSHVWYLTDSENGMSFKWGFWWLLPRVYFWFRQNMIVLYNRRAWLIIVLISRDNLIRMRLSAITMRNWCYIVCKTFDAITMKIRGKSQSWLCYRL